jgi:hypothetical protein
MNLVRYRQEDLIQKLVEGRERLHIRQIKKLILRKNSPHLLNLVNSK